MGSPLLRTTVSLLLLQLVSRLFSFGLNQFLLRSTSPAALGIATMSLEVLRDTTLFLLREGIRSAVLVSCLLFPFVYFIHFCTQRTRGDGKSILLRRQTHQIPLLLSPLLLPLFLLYAIYPPTPLPPSFHPTLLLYLLSTLIELLAESSYLQTLENWETLTTKRVKAEGLAVGIKAVGTLLAVRYGGEGGGLLGFGVGQVAYSLVLLGGFSSIVRSFPTSFIIRPIYSPTPPRTGSTNESLQGNSKIDQERTKGIYFDSGLTSLSWALTKQSFVKQFLTEGDKIVVGRLSKPENQGGYAIALNYG